MRFWQQERVRPAKMLEKRNGAPRSARQREGTASARFVSGPHVSQGLVSSRIAEWLPQCSCLSPARPKFILLWLTPFPQGIFRVKPDGQTSTLDPASLNPSLCPAPFLVLVAGPAPGPYPSILVAAPASATMGLVCDRDLFPTPVASSLRA